jgi:hypothetical protein
MQQYDSGIDTGFNPLTIKIIIFRIKPFLSYGVIATVRMKSEIHKYTYEDENES